MVYLEGKLTHRKYEDSNGQTKYFTEVVGNYMRNLTKRDEAGSGYFPAQEPGTTSAPANNVSSAPASQPTPANKPAAPVAENTAPAADDDLPF